MSTLQTVHVRVTDRATGQPVPCRVRFSDLEGNHYAPFGRLTSFALASNRAVGGNVQVAAKPYAYVDGSFEIRLPSTLLHVQIEKGPEYLPLRTEVQLTPGKLSLRFQIERWTNLREQDWYSGDTCVHALPPHAALLEAQAEDVAVVNLLAKEIVIPGPFHNTLTAIPNLLAFSGQEFALSKDGHGVAINTLNVHPELGSLGLLCCHRVVYPLRFGGPLGSEDWTLADWCDQCHRKGGLVVWTGDKHRKAQAMCGEPLADLFLGKIDAFEIDSWDDSPADLLYDWYTLLDAGCNVPLVGASGKDSNGIALGVLRTYAHLQPGQEFGYRAWIEAVRAGRTFVTNGPLLLLTVDEQAPARTPVEVPARKSVRIRAEATSRIAFEQLEIVWNNEVIASIPATCDTIARALVEIEHPIDESGWLAARCRGANEVFDLPHNQRVFAHTSPVYVACVGQPFVPKPEAVQGLAEELDRMLEWTQTKGRFATPKEQAGLEGVFRTARQALLKK